MRLLARSSLPVVFTPGVVHLPSVPAHRKVNRVDMGTADKVCAAALAVHEQAERRGCGERDVSFILLELGGAFTAAIAVEHGRIVDGAGGTSGPLGVRGAGALDGEVAFLAGSVSKGLLFGGGAATIAGPPDAPAEALASPTTPRGRLAWEAYLESAVKAVAALAVSAPHAREVSCPDGWPASPACATSSRDGSPASSATRRSTCSPASRRWPSRRPRAPRCSPTGSPAARRRRSWTRWAFARRRGTVLDHLYVISPAAARARLGIA